MVHTHISPRFRITIPKEVRELTDLHIGDRVAFLQKGEEIVIVKVPENPLAEMAGSLSINKDVRNILRELKEEDIQAESS